MMSKAMTGVFCALLLLCGAASGQNFSVTQGDSAQEVTTDLKSQVTINIPSGDGVYVTFKVNGVWETEVHSHTGTEGSNPPYTFAIGDIITAVRIEYRTGGVGSPLVVSGSISQ